ncbi:hypothetical protein [Dechloromonas sp. CZR5]|uniref:hypothetical protein n=1 Tax=Dechloromonas sp. CZR5 TaxID=2608630 RepID=UPI00123CB437|nr:hypothetical protein [Dechloromonas sp. CZR5]
MSPDAINTTISITSLVVALCTVFAAHHYFLRAQRQRDEELIQNILKRLSTFKVDVLVINRERNKTGAPIDNEELDLLANCQSLSAMVAKLEEILLSVLNDRKNLTPEIRSKMQTLSVLVDGASIQLQTISTKFINFNNNQVARLHELNGKPPEIKALLDRVVAGRNTHG